MSFFSRLAGVFRGRKLDSELDDELRAHLEMRIDHNVAGGMSAEDARRDAMLRFGNRSLMKEDTRRADIIPSMESVAQDVKFGLRMLRKSPGFTIAAVVTLALGIGANTAVFSLLRAVLLRPLPFPHGEQLVRVDEADASGAWKKSGMALRGVSPVDLAIFREQNGTFEQLAGWTGGTAIVTLQDQPRRIDATSVTFNLFAALGVHPVMGRDFAPADEAAAGNHVVIVSDPLWRALGTKAVLNQPLLLDGEAYTIVGVMPARFHFPLEQDDVALWQPLTLDRNPQLRAATYLDSIGRLKSGVTAAQAKNDLDVISARIPTAAMFGKSRWVTGVVNLKDDMTASSRVPLWILMSSVMLVLLIAAANVASLCLSRAAARQREVAVRLALGCSRGRLLRQLLTESMLLALLGGGTGLLLALWSNRALPAAAPASLPRVLGAQLDWMVLGFALLLSLVTGVAAGLAPAVQASRFNIQRVLKEGAGAFRARHQPLHTWFTVAQLALAATLLCGAGLMVRTLVRLASVDPGFDARGVLTAEVDLPQHAYSEPAQQNAFGDEVLRRIRALPGVESVAAAGGLPMGGSRFVFHLQVTDPGHAPISVISTFDPVTPDFFRTLGIPLKQGRFFTDADNADTQTVAIVNESLAKARWPGQDPLGKSIPTGFTAKAAVVVGIVRDIRQEGMDQAPQPALYVPMAQRAWRPLRIVVRAPHIETAALAAQMREQLRAVDSAQTLDRVMTLDQITARSVAERRFFMLLLSVFAVLALVLAAVGVFGVVSYGVAQRTREIGVRIALGATGSNVMGMIVRRSLLLTVVALATGLGASLALTRLLRTLLYEIKPDDPLTFVSAAVLLAAVALGATLLPARRATRVDPMVALRYE